MNSPASGNFSKDQLIQRLARRKPLYQALQQHLDGPRKLHAELLEPRLLLSADILAAADALKDGLDDVDAALDSFFDNDLLNANLPLLIHPGDGAPGSLNDMLSLDVNLDGSFNDIDGDGSQDAGEEDTIQDADDPDITSWEERLQDFDDAGDGNGRVSLGEFISGMVIDPAKTELERLQGLAADELPANPDAAFATFLTGLADSFDEVVSNSPFADTFALDIIGAGVSAVAGADGDGTDLAISLNFELDFGREIGFDLGAELEDLGLSISDEELVASVDGNLAFDFTFGIEGEEDDGETAANEYLDSLSNVDNFYIEINELSASVAAGVDFSVLDGESLVQIGFLGLGATGALQLNASAAAAPDPGSDSRLLKSELSSGLGDFVFSETTANVQGDLDLSVDTGLDGVAGTVEFDLNQDFDLDDLTSSRENLNFSYSSSDIQELLNFNRLTPAAFIGLLEQLAGFLGGMSDSDLISGFEIPFASANVGDILDFAGMLRDQLLFDDLGGSGEKLLDAEGNPTFDTIQDLVAELNGFLPSGFSASYDSAENEFTLDMVIGGDFELLETDLSFDVDLDPIANITNTDGTLALNGAGEISLTLGIDLGDVQGSRQIDWDTPLESDGGDNQLNDSVEVQQVVAITGNPIEDFSPLASYDLQGPALFTIELSGTVNKDGAHTITVPDNVNAQDGEVGNITDLVADINTGLNDAGISLYIQAERDGDWFRLALTGPAADSDDSFKLDGTANSVAKAQLGLADAIADGADEGFAGYTQAAPLVVAYPGVSTETELELEISGVTLTLDAFSLSSNNNILSLVRDINTAILGGEDDMPGDDVLYVVDPDDDSVRLAMVEVSSSGQRLIISATEHYDEGTLGPLRVAENLPLGFDDGDGVEEETTELASTQTDFIINPTDGVAIEISLAGLSTLGELRAEIESQAGVIDDTLDPADQVVRVTLEFNEEQTGLVVVDNTFVEISDPDNYAGPVFNIESTNGSTAALQLGIAGEDDSEASGLDGRIEGRIVAGPTLADRVFLENGVISGALRLTADDVTATASFGFADVTLAGSGSLGAMLSTGLKAPEGALGSRVTLAELQANLGKDENGNRNIDKVIALPTLSGDVSSLLPDSDGDAYGSLWLSLDVETNPASPIDLLGGITPQVGLVIENLGNPLADLDTDGDGEISAEEAAVGRPEISVNTDALNDLNISRFTDIGFGEILDGLIAVSDFLGDFEEFGFLDAPIPLIEVSINEVLSFADRLDAAVNSAFDDPAGSIQALEGGLRDAFGLDPDSEAVSLTLVDADGVESVDGSVLRLDLSLDGSFSESLGVDLDLTEFLPEGVDDLLQGASLAGSAGLVATGNASLKVAFGIDLGLDDSEALGDIYIYDDGVDGQEGQGTGLNGSINVAGVDLSFRGAIGPAGIFVEDGSAEIPATFFAGFDFDDPALVFDADTVPGEGVAPDFDQSPEFIGFSELIDDFEASFDASLDVSLPVSFPTETSEPTPVTISGAVNAAYDAGSGDSIFATTGLTVDGLDAVVGKFDLSELSLMDNILLVVDGVDLFLDGLQDIMDGEIGGMTLPLVGDSLADGARFIEEFRETFLDKFREGIESFNSDGQDVVSQLLSDLLTDLGFADFTVTRTGNFDDPNAEVEDTWIQWNVSFGKELVDAGADISLDLGIPGLGIETEGDIELYMDWNLDLGFGLSFAEGAYLDVSDPDELTFDVLVTLPDAAITGTLGFLQMRANDLGDTHLAASFGIDVVNNASAPANADRLGFSDLGKIGFDATVAAEAVADLGLTLEISSDLVPGESGVFPKIESEFSLDWQLGELEADLVSKEITVSETENVLAIGADSIQTGLQVVEFTDVRLDLGAFLNDYLSPVLAEVQNVTGPMEEIIDFITAPLPVISDLGPDLSLVDIAETFGKVDLGFIESIEDLVSLINAIPTDADTLEIIFGDFVVYDDGEESGVAITDLDLSNKRTDLSTVDTSDSGSRATSSGENLDNKSVPGGNNSKSALDKIKSSGSFAFPILTDPSQVFGLLMGQEAVLMTYDLNPLEVEFEYSQFFPIFGPLGASITGSLGVSADFAFGYDTLGISQFADSGFRNPELIFNGFYVSDTENADGTGADVAELELNLGLAAAAELNLGVARGGVAGGVYADIFFNLYDPDRDGKVRVEELIGSVVTEFEYGDYPYAAPLAIFDVTGEVYAKLFAYVYVDLLLFSIDFEENITPEITILDFEIPFTRPAQLASEIGDGTLQLNMGEMAGMRLNGDVSDGAESYYVSGDADSLTVSFGAPLPASAGASLFAAASSSDAPPPQAYDTPQTMLILGGDGDDVIDLSGITGTGIHFEIDGGAGNDTIILGGNSNSTSIVNGGAGDDIIIGSAGKDIIIGGAGQDIIFGEGGDDQLFGDDAEVSDTYTLRARVGTTDGNDWIYGGTGKDIIVGSGGSDRLQGDVMYVDVSALDKRELFASNPGTGNDLIIGDAAYISVTPTTAPEPGDAIPVPDFVIDGTGLTVEDTDRGEGGIDYIRGNGGDDVVFGGGGDDDILGGSGGDTLHGEEGADTIDGEDDNDLILGGKGRDILSGGDHDDRIEGGAGDDVINGNLGNDELFGGTGADLMHGNGGNDKMRGGGDRDEMYGDAGNDYLDGDFGDDLLFGDSGTYDPLTAGEITPADMLDDTLVSSYGNDVLDGEGGGDTYIVNVIGGTTDKLVTTFDSGNQSAGPDSLEINGSVETSYDEETGLVRTETYLDQGDNYLLRANPNRTYGLAFVALLNEDEASERIDYTAAMESLTINSGLGSDYFALDDNRAATTINGGEGNDVFQVGQMFNLPRTVEDAAIQPHPNPVGENANDPDYVYNEGETDITATIETTRGFLSNGITEATVINGGSGEDSFTVFHNKAVLSLNGGSGDDEFSVRAFALAGSQESQRERTDISGGSDADLIQYAVNAPVGIDGGDGLDTVITIGTEFRDDFVITQDGVFGAGLNISYVNIEVLKVDGAEGDDRFFIQGTNAGTVTTVVGGLGSDSFNVAGDAPPIISNDLLGHSGKISHTVVSTGDAENALYTEVRARDVVANVADSNEPGIVLTPVEEQMRVVEGNVSGVEGLQFATYAVVLSKPPRSGETVVVTAFAPQPDQEAKDAGKGLIQFVPYDDGDPGDVDPVISGDMQKVTLTFTTADWDKPQEVRFEAIDDGISEGAGGAAGDHYGLITHSISSDFLFTGTGATFNNASPDIVLDANPGLPTDGSVAGGLITITDGTGKGQTRGIESYDNATGLTLTTSWNLVPAGDSQFEITLLDGTTYTGGVASAQNNTTMTLAPGDAGEFADGSPANTLGDLRGATLEITGGAGAGQERLIMSSTDSGVVLNKPWSTAPDETSQFQIQTYTAVKAPGLTVRIDDFNTPLPENQDYTPEPGVRIIETNGSTNVIEPLSGGDATPSGDAYVDSYDVVLTEAPAEGEVVKVYVNPEPTITTRGQIFYKELQVVVGGDHVQQDEGGFYLEFNSDNYAVRQTVEVRGLVDTVVDGGDTKVFPDKPRIVNDIQGPLIIEGQGESELSIGSLGDPLMLPGENNTLPSLGDVLGADSNGIQAATAQASLSVVNTALEALGLTVLSDVLTYTFEITEGPGRGEAHIIKGVDVNDGVVTFTFDEDTDWDVEPDETSSFTLSRTNPNLLVDESEQVDVVTIFNDESVTDDVGTLTASNLSGLGMGGDLTFEDVKQDDGSFQDVTYSGGITYSEMENFTLNLGKGSDMLTVDGTHTRPGSDYQTVTLINAGRGDDEIDINLTAGVDGFIAVKGEEGGDTIDASDSSADVIAFGDEGGDTLRGGSGNDILLGDIGRIDYLGEEGQVVTRLGLEHDFATMVSLPETDEQVPSNQTDGVVRAASLILSLDESVGAMDTIEGNEGNDIIIGGAAGDRLDGGMDSDLVLGDNVSLTRVDAGNLSALEQSLPGGGRLYDTDGNANVGSGVDSGGKFSGPFDTLHLTLRHHSAETTADYFGDDYIAGGGGDDLIFGQKGADTVQGDGSIYDGTDGDVSAIFTDGEMTGSASTDRESDGNDYIEGNAGADTVFGNLGQDVIIGGSSDLFGLNSASDRADGSDILLGGSGTETGRYNDAQGEHVRDADLILGDNARVAILPDEGYTFDDPYEADEGSNIVRVYTLLDYTAGADASGVGAADEIHGEGGDDIIHGMLGNDILFGEAQDDNIIGGVGHDRIYGGNGVDGVLGDDGIIQTSRNGETEALNGVTSPNNQELLEPKGKGVGAWIHPNGDIHKSVEVQAWEQGGNDIIYGGLGDDFLHGGAGSDAISGAEAEDIHYNSSPRADGVIADLALDAQDDSKFARFDADNPRPLLPNHILNFDVEIAGEKAEDGVDRIFGDLGDDWLVGGTGTDRVFGGLGNDLLNLDDNLNTESVEEDQNYAEGDFAFGGGGRDVLIGNTGRDRLFDWSGEYNSYYVPFSQFGAPTVNRKISPDTVQFLLDLGEGSGADTSLIESNGELGLVTQKDPLWKSEKGGPRDPQPGTLNGKIDDVGDVEEDPNALHAAAAPLTITAVDVLTLVELELVGQAAVERWIEAGMLSPEQLAQLASMHLQIADLGGLKLAQASGDGKTIYVDPTAAGHGWFVDLTPLQDSEFTTQTMPAGMDLLSVIMHEIGHLLGHEHEDHGLMARTLDAGSRIAASSSVGQVHTFDDVNGMEIENDDWLEVSDTLLGKTAADSGPVTVDWNDSF